MKKYNLTATMQSCTWDELSDEQRAVVSIAKEQINHSYCPYSHFHVGAAAQLANGEIIRGCNQENAAYPSGLCAERTALFAAGAQYPDQPVLRLAIACYTGGHFTKLPGSPCGGCRQVMVETEHRYGGKMEVLLYGEEETYVFESAADLLPLTFVKENLLGE
ncbi:MAG: cytidine deaminase [Paludibacteraceae bacterium]|nr:cytidine deaminase [Paludibacteraceae bacterium]MBQ6764933.1 cytidine deaminase [Paludibacteraceae bacterium]